jgi:predicted acylesterase/phospholipase RssA
LSLSGGQRDALAQLRAVEQVASGALEIVDVRLPDSNDWLRIDISVDCRGVEHRPSGLRLRERERLRVLVDPSFPFEAPSVLAVHGRWAGAAHVQWGISLCLYAAAAVEWNPSDGMFGFLDRLWLWLEKASAGELDPADAPLHPPVVYVSGLDEIPMVIPRADTPPVTDTPWIGGVEIAKISESRVDLIGWQESATSWLEGAAPAILLPSTLDFEYPRTVSALLDALAARGVSRKQALAILKLGALGLEKDQPLIVVIGTAMRGTAAGRRQHLAAWYVEPLFAWGLAHSLQTNAADPELRDSAKRVEEIMTEWAAGAKIHWCPVREDRPEVTRRRDLGSPLESFAGKTVAIWGCGALGAPIAEWIARAGAAKLILYDKASVAPGVLVRQPFTDENIGKNKARVLAEQLRQIRPRDLDVEVHARNVLQSALEREDWHDGAEIVIDATASSAVSIKLERARRFDPQPAAIVSMILGHTAQHVLAVLAPPNYSGAGADVMRQVKLACGRKPSMREFLREFWPDPSRTAIFQPEPGCSDPTFTGSGTEVAALAAHALTRIAAEPAASDDGSAVAHLATLDARRGVPREARLSFPPAQRIAETITDFEVRISSTAAIGLRSAVAAAAREVGPESETGGLLFGERDAAAGVIWVDEIVGPPPDSRRSPEEFVCGTEGVAGYEREKAKRGQGSLQYLGMWHTHPTQDPIVSQRDIGGIARLLDAASSPISHGLLLILGHTLPGLTELGAFVFQRSEIENPDVSYISFAAPTALSDPIPADGEVGIALSGGGSRAIAFHLGCLRALHDRGILQRTRVISSVSGGSLISAMWAYGDEDFDTFEQRVTALLAAGLQRRLARGMLLSRRTPQLASSRALTATTAAVSRFAAIPARARRHQSVPRPPPRQQRVSRTDVLADVLERDVVGRRRIDAPRRDGLDVVINACELSTGSAFRFGSRESGCWRTGRLAENDAPLATAVAASAAYPLALPALDRRWTFQRRNGSLRAERIALSDGGLYDNLGTTCLEPGRSPEYGYNLFAVDYIIACDAGRGLLDPVFPSSWLPRVRRSFEASFRKLQDGGRGRLHALTEAGALTGFAMPYLGQQDRALPAAPADLVSREAVADYPTDFRAMSNEMIALLSRRGEQLTNVLLDIYLPGL